MSASKNEVMQVDLPISVIDPNPDNDKVFNMENIDSLADAIKRNGFRGTIEVFQKKDGRYEISAGHRRFLAAQKAGLTSIPALIYPMPQSDIEKRNLLIDSNIYNREFTPLDKARAINYQRETLMMGKKKDENISVWNELMKHFNMSRGSVSTYLSILDLIPELQQMYAEQNLSIYVATLLSDKSEELQRLIWQRLQKLLSAQKADAEGKKRLSTAQVSMVIERVEAEYIQEGKDYEEASVRVPDQYFSTYNVTPPPVVKVEQVRKKADVQQDYATEGQKNFEAMQRGMFAANTSLEQVTVQPVQYITQEYKDTIYEDEPIEEVEPIDTAFFMLTIQVQKLAASKVKVNDKAKMLANIDIMKKAIDIIENEI